MADVKIYLDDYRTAPRGWELAKNFNEFTNLIEHHIAEENRIVAIAFDHDLEPDHYDSSDVWRLGKTGYDAAMWLIGNHPQVLRDVKLLIVHSMSPSGGDRIERALFDHYNRGDEMWPTMYRRPGWDHRANEGRYKVNL